MKSETIRKTWPRVRQIVKDGTLRYIVDGRYTNHVTKTKEGSLMWRSTKEDAITLAQELESTRYEGGSLTTEEKNAFIYFRNRCVALEVPVNEALEKALRFYNKKEIKKTERETISELAEQWYQERSTGKGGRVKMPRPATLVEMFHTKKILCDKWGHLKYSSLDKKDIKAFCDSIPHPRTAKKWRVRISGFCNWVIDSGLAYGNGNPARNIKDAQLSKKLPEILTADVAKKLIRECESNERFLPLVHYVAISLWAGLRPKECERITWKNIDLWDKPQLGGKYGATWGAIKIEHTVAKNRRARFVTINETLARFLKAYSDVPIFTPKNHRKRYEALRKKLGYEYGEKRNEQTKWQHDCLRHSYATYHLAKHQDEAGLAFLMGNSVTVIKDFYYRPTPEHLTNEYWNVLPLKELPPPPTSETSAEIKQIAQSQ